MRCFQQKAVFAHLVPQKGLGGRNVACDFVLCDLEWLGHTRVIVKADNEPAILQLLREAIKGIKTELELADQIGEEHPRHHQERLQTTERVSGFDQSAQIVLGELDGYAFALLIDPLARLGA